MSFDERHRTMSETGQDSSGNKGQDAPARQPNVVIILTDQQRWDTISAHGNDVIHTPNLDRLAEQSLDFDNAFCTAPLCTPSRLSLLTGLYPHQHLGTENRVTLPPGLPTLASELRDAGYDTAAVGKMHFTPTRADVGFERLTLAEQDGDGRFEDDYHSELVAAGFLDDLDLVDQRAEYRARAGDQYWESFGAAESSVPERWHSTTWIGDQAVDEIGSWSGTRKPHLLAVGFIKPHHPFDPPSRWLAEYDPDLMPLTEGWTPALSEVDAAYGPRYLRDESLTVETLQNVIAHYYASISHLDAHVGRILDAIESSGEGSNTIIVFTSDHGDFLGYHHMLLKHGPPYDPIVKVPLLIRMLDGHSAPGRRSDLVSLVDVMPTVLRACGVDSRNALPGQDLAAGPSGRDVVFSSTAEGYLMVRTTTTKLIITPPGESDLYFDLLEDPNELDPLPAGEDTLNLRAKALSWLLHEARAPFHVDTHARTVPSETARSARIQRRMREKFNER